MRQVPTAKYLIIGSGRMARHFCYYLSLLEIPYNQWSRAANNAEQLNHLVEKNQIILILINDNAIESFIQNHTGLANKKLIHFSGALETNLAIGMHPLMTFGAELYSLDIYQKIPFISTQANSAIQELLPGLNNPIFTIPQELKAYYHALCVMSGNFSVLLWQKLFSELEKKLKIPKETTHLYLQQIFNNLKNTPEQALTGPLVRNDQETIAKHLQVLAHDPFQKIYQTFIEVYQKL